MEITLNNYDYFLLHIKKMNFVIFISKLDKICEIICIFKS